MKVNLLLDMVGRLLVQNQPRPSPARVRFNARGARWKRFADRSPDWRTDANGVFELYLHDSVIDPLRFTGRIETIDADDIVYVRFDAHPDPIVNLVDKIIFRRHRRLIADARNPKRG
jgi:atypical PilZ domain-containing cyclic di-GMP receptor